MKILFLSAWNPYPPNNGSKLRISNLIRGLEQCHKVTLITFADEYSTVSTPGREPRMDIHSVPRRAYNPASARALLGIFSSTPRSLVDSYEPLMADCIRRELTSQPYDLVIASQWDTAVYWRAFGQLPAIFEEIEVGVFDALRTSAANPFQRLRHELTWLKLRYYAPLLLSHFRACTVASSAERDLVQRLAPICKTIQVVPNGVNVADYAGVEPTRQPNTLIFTGSFRYFANHDAMRWFLSEVYPRVQAQVPQVRLTITGDHADLPLPSATGVSLTGFVEDVRPSIAKACIDIAPIRIGGGTRLKILEAMALRTPVVSTSKGAEGLEVEHGEHVLIADSPEAFAQAVIDLLQHPELARRLAHNAYQFVRERFDWAVILPKWLDFVSVSSKSL